MKKLLLALSLFSVSIHAEHEGWWNPSEPQKTTQPEAQEESPNAPLIAFIAKFKALHAMALRNYRDIEARFEHCASNYISIYEHLDAIQPNANLALQEQIQQIKHEIEPLGKQLARNLNYVKEVNALMYQFNGTILEEFSYQELLNILMTVIKKLVIIQEQLESIDQEITALQYQALALGDYPADSAVTGHTTV